MNTTVSQINRADNEKRICVLKSGTFSDVTLAPEHKLDLSSHVLRSEYLRLLNEKFKGRDEIFIGTTGNTAREMYSHMPDTRNFYMAGNMGGALSLGLGAAKGGERS